MKLLFIKNFPAKDDISSSIKLPKKKSGKFDASLKISFNLSRLKMITALRFV